MFPFSPLPLVPQELILKQLEPYDIFKFSLISRKCHLLAKRSKVVVQNLSWSFNTDKIDLIFTRVRKNKRFQLHIPIIPTANRFRTTKFEAQIDGTSFSVHSASTSRRRIDLILTGRFDVLAEKFSRRLLDVLQIQTFSMSITNCSIPPYVLETTRTFERIHAYFDNASYYKEEALTLLHDITVNGFQMYWNFKEDYPRLEPLKHRSMILDYDASWFTKDFLMRMQCEELKLYRSKLTSADVDEFFEAWKRGNCPKLKILKIVTVERLQLSVDMGAENERGWRIIKNVGGNTGMLKMKMVMFTLYCLEFVVVASK